MKYSNNTPPHFRQHLKKNMLFLLFYYKRAAMNQAMENTEHNSVSSSRPLLSTDKSAELEKLDSVFINSNWYRIILTLVFRFS